MGQLTVGNLFTKTYEATSAAIKLGGFATDEPWGKLVPKLREVAGESGFDPIAHQALNRLREALDAAAKKSIDEATFLSRGAALDTSGSANAMASAEEVSRSAALKLLRHTYHHARRHNHRLWIVSLPESYTQWPHKYLVGSRLQLVTRLAAGNERFSAGERIHISDATQRGLRWVHKAQLALDDLTDGARGLRLLKRWFADEDTTVEQLRNFADTALKPGLKKIAPKMSGGSLVVTDFVPIRASEDAGDKKTAASNAFVTTADSMDVIYIEKPFFTHSASSVFQKDERHWARIMVHEMTHREAATKDHRYGWKGIKPAKGVFSSADAMENADSWALFVANAAGAMSKTDISRSQKGTVG